MAGQELLSMDFSADWDRTEHNGTSEQDHTDSIRVTDTTEDVSTRSGSFRVAEFQAASFRSLLNALPIPAMLVDQTYSVVFANNASQKVNIDSHKIEGGPFSQCCPTTVAAWPFRRS